MNKEQIKKFLEDCYVQLEKEQTWLDSDAGLLLDFILEKLEELNLSTPSHFFNVKSLEDSCGDRDQFLPLLRYPVAP